MSEISKERMEWLRGAYLDRITETARSLRERITHPVASIVEKESAEKLRGEYAYLSELTAEEQAWLEDETVRELMVRLRDDRDYELRHKYGREMMQAAVGFQMRSGDAAYHFDERAFDDAMFIAFGALPATDDDRVVMREICLRYVWPRLRQAHGNLRVSTYRHLLALNQESISPRAEFSMDIGWAVLIQQAANRIEAYPDEWRVRIVGGKEKLGCCVIHVDCDYSQRGCRSEVERLREEIRLRSLATCEICGSSGRLRLSGFAKTVCDKHAAVMGEMREDDGRWADPYKWHNDQVDIDLLKNMDPPIQRSAEHITNPLRAIPLGRRIDDDTWSRSGREQELLVEFGWHLQDAVQGACVKVEYLDGYVREEVAGWREFAVQPLTESDEKFLRGYLRELIDAEYEWIRIKQEAERS